MVTERLPQCDSPTNPTGNGKPDGRVVGLSYHGSRDFDDREWYNDDMRLPQFVRLPQCDSPTVPTGNGKPDGRVVGLPYYDSRTENGPEINEEMQRRANRSGRLSHIIGQYKSAVTKYANQHDIPFVWQPRFHDHIIRNIFEMNRIANYIQNNPMKWELDRFYQKR